MTICQMCGEAWQEQRGAVPDRGREHSTPKWAQMNPDDVRHPLMADDIIEQKQQA
jgi:hypothetical protein